jgi:hypothetical protein
MEFNHVRPHDTLSGKTPAAGVALRAHYDAFGQVTPFLEVAGGAARGRLGRRT